MGIDQLTFVKPCRQWGRPSILSLCQYYNFHGMGLIFVIESQRPGGTVRLRESVIISLHQAYLNVSVSPVLRQYFQQIRKWILHNMTTLSTS